MTGTAAQQAVCGSVGYREAESTVPVLSCPSNCIAQPLQNLHVEMTSDAMSRWDEVVSQTVDIKEFRELFDCPVVVITALRRMQMSRYLY
jgi:hypothetical protein